MAGKEAKSLLVPPAVTALRDQVAVMTPHRNLMERTISMDIREEREDLREAAEQTLNVILDIGLNGVVRWVSPSWRDVIGTQAEAIQNRPIGDIVLETKSVFTDAIEEMLTDDSRSRIIRFTVEIGPFSKFATFESDIFDLPELDDLAEGGAFGALGADANLGPRRSRDHGL